LGEDGGSWSLSAQRSKVTALRGALTPPPRGDCSRRGALPFYYWPACATSPLSGRWLTRLLLLAPSRQPRPGFDVTKDRRRSFLTRCRFADDALGLPETAAAAIRRACRSARCVTDLRPAAAWSRTGC